MNKKLSVNIADTICCSNTQKSESTPQMWVRAVKTNSHSNKIEGYKLISSESYISYCGRSESVNVIPQAWPSRLENAPLLTWNNKNLHEIQVGAGGDEICDREAHTTTLRDWGLTLYLSRPSNMNSTKIFSHLLEPYLTLLLMINAYCFLPFHSNTFQSTVCCSLNTTTRWEAEEIMYAHWRPSRAPLAVGVVMDKQLHIQKDRPPGREWFIDRTEPTDDFKVGILYCFRWL